MKNLGEKIKESVATTVSDALSNKILGGGTPCVLIGLGEPTVPTELILENAE